MVGGGISSTNVFAALETLKKKKKGSSKSQAKEPVSQLFWAPAPLRVKSWADVDDDDDDDYFATTAPPQSVWGKSEPEQNKDIEAPVEEESESESENDDLDECDDDVVEEPEKETEVLIPAESVVKKPPPASVVPKETERQLSKKELKKKERAELEAVLAEFGVSDRENKSAGQDETNGVAEEKKSEQQSVDGEKKDNAPALMESKSSKKKKAKKDKSSKEVKDLQEQSPNGSVANDPDEGTGTEPTEEEKSAVDVKERLKRVASMKKKKSSKEMAAASKAAANEAAARSAKLAAAKKKEKNHYNQQPVR